jgi:exopolyphosphatase/guanosine-5'-triphosphate,3'-diphosphate pyrophosphatase
MAEMLAGAAAAAAPARTLAMGRAGPEARRLCAAVDLGTNNCRLLIARPCGEGRDFQVVDSFSRVVRLGEGLGTRGALSEAAMDRALAALAVCADKMAKRGVQAARSVATEACRRAVNGADFVRRVYAETGIALDVITPAEEARLAVMGCQTLIDRKARRCLVFDIGGGSTELVLLERVNGNKVPRRPGADGAVGWRGPEHRIRRWVSVPWGVVSLAETEPLDAGNPTARLAAYARMKERVARHLGPLEAEARGDVQLLGASGTVTTLASLYLGLAVYDRKRVDGTVAPTAAIRAIAHDLAVRGPADRALVPGIGADRADLVVAGCAILEAVMDLSPAPVLSVADRGIREGILRSLLAVS